MVFKRRHTTELSALLALPFILVIAAALRLYLAWQAHVATIDTAVVGQMALNILEGDRPLFFSGQNYMGALEAYTLALVFIFVEPGHVTMTLATVAFTLAWVGITYVFFRRVCGPWPAVAAASVAALPGWSPVWYTTAPFGGYPQTYFFGMALLWLALDFDPERPVLPSWRHALGLALIAGIGLWTNFQIMPYLGAAGIAGLIFAYRHRTCWRQLWPYGMVVLAVGATLLLPMLGERAHEEVPVLSGFSWGSIRRSWQGLWARDLAACLHWTGHPAFVQRIASILYVVLLAGGIVLTIRWPRPTSTLRQARRLLLCFVVLFAITYFPHPMTGYVPRYLIAPLMFVLSWSLAVWIRAPHRWVSRTGWGLALVMALYNVHGTWQTARLRAPGKEATLAEFQSIIRAARAQNWRTIQHTGSQTEGYEAARLSFAARGYPVFTSAFSERFLSHQAAWEFSDTPALLSRRSVWPFLQGSYTAVGAAPGHIVEAGPYALIENPPVQRKREFSVVPIQIHDSTAPTNQHALFDRSSRTAWPDVATDAASIVLEFDPPIRLGGLRAVAARPVDLPYRYLIRGRTPNGDWQAIQRSEQRIAAAYLSGDQLYLRGFNPWMDIRFPSIEIDALEWRVESGPANPTPPRLTQLFVLAAEDKAWPALGESLDALLGAIARYPAARVVAERGVLRLLHRHASIHNRAEALIERIPLPYNPRFRRTLPNRMPLPTDETILILEEGYAEDAYQRIQSAGYPIEAIAAIPPFAAYRVGPAAAGPTKLHWCGFTVVH